MHLFEDCSVVPAIELFAKAGAEGRGAVFTRYEVVEFILDLAGYAPDRPLHRCALLEPSCGEGDFLLPAVRRLLASYRAHGGKPDGAGTALAPCVRAVELHHPSCAKLRERLRSCLVAEGIPEAHAASLISAWLTEGDFLLAPFERPFDFVIGNPPYVRQELIPDALLAAYRDLFSTIFDRADLYIPFIEKSLHLLRPNGALAFICSDRWMKNRYGVKLRRFVGDGYRLKYYVDMVNTPAFDTDVIAYPAVTVITHEKNGPTRLAHRPEINTSALRALRDRMTGPPEGFGNRVSEVSGIVQDGEPWILEATDQLALARRLETEFPLIEEVGCLVGIGVATGADQVFIAPFDALDVEPDRKLPLVTTKDIKNGRVEWRGLGVVNPFEDSGRLVDLARYPKLKSYLHGHEDQIRRRNVAKRAPSNWYRTIDRIYPERAYRPKLLIPDIKGSAHIVYEEGHYYPHHNLYYITSNEWDLHALQTVLVSGIARLFVGLYSVVMHGGFLRFQAQYLRRIRLPHWADVPQDVRAALIAAARRGDKATCNEAVSVLYRLSPTERAAIAADVKGA